MSGRQTSEGQRPKWDRHRELYGVVYNPASAEGGDLTIPLDLWVYYSAIIITSSFYRPL